MCADRARYELQQAALLDALQGRDSIPDGFVGGDLDAAAESLLLKRARPVANAWPALTHALGGEFRNEFKRFAGAFPPPPGDDGMIDGLLFANTLDPNVLTDEAKVEILVARATLEVRAGACLPRRGLFLSVALLNEPRRLFIVSRIPMLGRRPIAVPIQLRRLA